MEDNSSARDERKVLKDACFGVRSENLHPRIFYKGQKSPSKSAVQNSSIIHCHFLLPEPLHFTLGS